MSTIRSSVNDNVGSSGDVTVRIPIKINIDAGLNLNFLGFKQNLGERNLGTISAFPIIEEHISINRPVTSVGGSSSGSGLLFLIVIIIIIVVVIAVIAKKRKSHKEGKEKSSYKSVGVQTPKNIESDKEQDDLNNLRILKDT